MGEKDLWCERGDSNPHGYPLDPKSSASASSATLASANGSPNFRGPMSCLMKDLLTNKLT